MKEDDGGIEKMNEERIEGEGVEKEGRMKGE